MPDNKVYLSVNAANGSLNATFISSKVGQILDGKDELKEYLIKRGGVKTHYMYFNSIKEAENCKLALKRPLLRFSLVKTQTNQSLAIWNYKYIPNIDWNNDKVKTDEGILELCKCPKDKCKEYVKYCENIINNINKKHGKN